MAFLLAKLQRELWAKATDKSCLSEGNVSLLLHNLKAVSTNLQACRF